MTRQEPRSYLHRNLKEVSALIYRLMENLPGYGFPEEERTGDQRLASFFSYIYGSPQEWEEELSYLKTLLEHCDDDWNDYAAVADHAAVLALLGPDEQYREEAADLWENCLETARDKFSDNDVKVAIWLRTSYARVTLSSASPLQRRAEQIQKICDFCYELDSSGDTPLPPAA